MATRGIRNNNPGNIEYGKFAKSMGATGSDGRFAIFPSVQAGIQAIQALQQRYERGGAQTIQQRINRWAPAFENNVSAYANAVASGVGVNPGDPISFLDANNADDIAFVKAMIRHENGSMPYTDQQITDALSGGTRPYEDKEARDTRGAIRQTITTALQQSGGGYDAQKAISGMYPATPPIMPLPRLSPRDLPVPPMPIPNVASGAPMGLSGASGMQQPARPISWTPGQSMSDMIDQGRPNNAIVAEINRARDAAHQPNASPVVSPPSVTSPTANNNGPPQPYVQPSVSHYGLPADAKYGIDNVLRAVALGNSGAIDSMTADSYKKIMQTGFGTGIPGMLSAMNYIKSLPTAAPAYAAWANATAKADPSVFNRMDPAVRAVVTSALKSAPKDPTGYYPMFNSEMGSGRSSSPANWDILSTRSTQPTSGTYSGDIASLGQYRPNTGGGSSSVGTQSPIPSYYDQATDNQRSTLTPADVVAAAQRAGVTSSGTYSPVPSFYDMATGNQRSLTPTPVATQRSTSPVVASAVANPFNTTSDNKDQSRMPQYAGGSSTGTYSPIPTGVPTPVTQPSRPITPTPATAYQSVVLPARPITPTPATAHPPPPPSPTDWFSAYENSARSPDQPATVPFLSPPRTVASYPVAPIRQRVAVPLPNLRPAITAAAAKPGGILGLLASLFPGANGANNAGHYATSAPTQTQAQQQALQSVPANVRSAVQSAVSSGQAYQPTGTPGSQGNNIVSGPSGTFVVNQANGTYTSLTNGKTFSLSGGGAISSGSSSGSSSSSGGTVLCTYFMRKGWLPRDLWRTDTRFSRRTYSAATMTGYYAWAVPAIASMQNGNRALEMILWPIVKYWAEEIGYRMGIRPKGSLIGKCVRMVLEPASWCIGLAVISARRVRTISA